MPGGSGGALDGVSFFRLENINTHFILVLALLFATKYVNFQKLQRVSEFDGSLFHHAASHVAVFLGLRLREMRQRLQNVRRSRYRRKYLQMQKTSSC